MEDRSKWYVRNSLKKEKRKKEFKILPISTRLTRIHFRIIVEQNELHHVISQLDGSMRSIASKKISSNYSTADPQIQWQYMYIYIYTDEQETMIRIIESR